MNISTHQNQNKSTSQLHMLIPCSIDSDCFEIIRTEAIKKYEENIYLLGKIFDNNRSSTLIKPDNDDEEEMSSIFDEKKIIDDNDDMDQQERMERMVREYTSRLKNPNCRNEALIKQLSTAFKEYQSDEFLLENNKKSFQESVKKFEDIVQKLKNVKTLESDTFYEDLINQADQLGIIPETFKQIRKIEKDKAKVNKEPPFDDDNNLLILPL